MHQQSAAKTRCTRGDPALFLPHQNDPGSADGRDLLRMKRAKPAANLPNQPVQPEKQSPTPPQIGQAQREEHTDFAGRAGKPQSQSIPLGLSTSSDPLHSATEPVTSTESQTKPRVERSMLPAILLEGDENENKPAPDPGPIRRISASEPYEPARTGV